MSNTFTTALDVSKPAGSRSKLLGDDDIREFKVQFAERFNIDHVQPTTEAGTDTIGFHRKATLIESGDPISVPDTLILYAKINSGVSELHTMHESQGSNRLTYLGMLDWEALRGPSEAEGDILYRSALKWSRLPKGAATNYLRMNAGATAPEWAASSTEFQPGMIILWSGSIGTIPSGWVLCDGNNSTPDLRARFVYGASDEATAGHASPGSSKIGSGVLAGNDSLVTHQSAAFPAGPTSGPSGPTSPYTGSTVDVMPPYYALAYIQKV